MICVQYYKKAVKIWKSICKKVKFRKVQSTTDVFFRNCVITQLAAVRFHGNSEDMAETILKILESSEMRRNKIYRGTLKKVESIWALLAPQGKDAKDSKGKKSCKK